MRKSESEKYLVTIKMEPISKHVYLVSVSSSLTYTHTPVFRASAGWGGCTLGRHFPWTKTKQLLCSFLFAFPIMILFCSFFNFNNYFVHAMHKIAQFTFANSTFQYFPQDQKHSQFDVPCNKDVVHEDVQLCAFLLKTTSPRRLWKSQMDYLQLSLYSVRNILE